MFWRGGVAGFVVFLLLGGVVFVWFWCFFVSLGFLKLLFDLFALLAIDK